MKVLGEFSVNLRLTDEAKQYLSELKSKSQLDNPIPGIGWGKWNHETEDHWMVSLYDRDECAGWLCKAPEFEFVIINPNLIERLHDRVLDVRDKKARIH